jgi:hypothetical protein
MSHTLKHLTRRTFMGLSAAGVTGLAITPVLAQEGEGNTTPIAPNFPQQDAAAVRAVVGASHGQVDRVKELVTARPALAKASWDWGYGDWESALGAASHTGRADIADVLIAHGARPNIFTFTMLGKLDAVRSMVEAVPGIQRTFGPHDITLMQHARNRLVRKDIPDMNRKNMEEVVAYLDALGDADAGAISGDMTEEQKRIYLGNYAFGTGSDNTFIVELHRLGWLSLKKKDGTGRRLNLVEPNTFAPSGAPAVKVRFEVVDRKATSLTIHDPMPLVKAVRM